MTGMIHMLDQRTARECRCDIPGRARHAPMLPAQQIIGQIQPAQHVPGDAADANRCDYVVVHPRGDTQAAI